MRASYPAAFEGDAAGVEGADEAGFEPEDFESLDFDSDDFESEDFDSDDFESEDFDSDDFESDFALPPSEDFAAPRESLR